jgi:TPR repeat protein
MHVNGWGVPKSYEEALKWYRSSADLGSSEGQYGLGLLYYRGHGVAQDYREAASWFRRAVEYADAREALGQMYVTGLGVGRDLVRAHMWLTLAAEGEVSGTRPRARSKRDQIAKELTREQLAKSKDMADRCKRSEFKDCGDEV